MTAFAKGDILLVIKNPDSEERTRIVLEVAEETARPEIDDPHFVTAGCALTGRPIRTTSRQLRSTCNFA